MFKKLDAVEVAEFKQWARDNYRLGEQIQKFWHPSIQEECAAMNEEEYQRAARERIKEVVTSVADINAELAGRIVVRVSFAGSLPKTKKLTKEEKKIVMKLESEINETSVMVDQDKRLNLALVGGDKTLWASKEYDALQKFVNDRRDEFASFGIPHVKFQAAHVVDITRIPEIEMLAEKTEVELRKLVEALVASYPSQITPEAVNLGPLYNERDYAAVETLMGRFTFGYEWLSFGVPEELKQFDVRIYEKAKLKAQETWKEIEANGVLLLRQTVSDLVSTLTDSLTPKDSGEKKKFYATTVTNIQDFLATFGRRNICNDTELDAEMKKLEQLVSGIDLKAMSSDTKLRESVKKDIEKTKVSLSKLLVNVGDRSIVLE
tara:strand:+ start:14275 stop:15405 length:1131 start_codon:yes stop_codon:yes gene_type:complete